MKNSLFGLFFSRVLETLYTIRIFRIFLYFQLFLKIVKTFFKKKILKKFQMCFICLKIIFCSKKQKIIFKKVFRACLVIIFENKILFLLNKKLKNSLTTKNCFLFLLFNNKK